MIVASVSFDADGSWRVDVQVDGSYPDALDDVVSRCARLTREVQAGLPEETEAGDADAQT